MSGSNGMSGLGARQLAISHIVRFGDVTDANADGGGACYLAAIAIFCNKVKGKSALPLSRDLNASYKCAFVLLHKLREAMAEELNGGQVNQLACLALKPSRQWISAAIGSAM